MSAGRQRAGRTRSDGGRAARLGGRAFPPSLSLSVSLSKAWRAISLGLAACVAKGIPSAVGMGGCGKSDSDSDTDSDSEKDQQRLPCGARRCRRVDNARGPPCRDRDRIYPAALCERRCPCPGAPAPRHPLPTVADRRYNAFALLNPHGPQGTPKSRFMSSQKARSDLRRTTPGCPRAPDSLHLLHDLHGKTAFSSNPAARCEAAPGLTRQSGVTPRFPPRSKIVANPHFSYPFYCGWSFPVLAALRLLAPRAVCSHTALRHSRRAPCQAGKFLRLVTKGMRNAG
jgi:hypothetical protein